MEEYRFIDFRNVEYCL